MERINFLEFTDQLTLACHPILVVDIEYMVQMRTPLDNLYTSFHRNRLDIGLQGIFHIYSSYEHIRYETVLVLFYKIHHFLNLHLRTFPVHMVH